MDIILITGMPGTGKTTLGTALSARYHLAFISKDALKDRMFDNLGWSDKAWSLQVSAASHRIMDYLIDEELRAGHSIIVESNFKRQIDSQRFRKFQQTYGCNIVQILCWAEGETVFQRFMRRMGTPARHEGHVEAISPERIRQEFIAANGKDAPLDIDGLTVEFNTTDLAALDYSGIYQAIEDGTSINLQR